MDSVNSATNFDFYTSARPSRQICQGVFSDLSQATVSTRTFVRLASHFSAYNRYQFLFHVESLLRFDQIVK